MSLNVASVQAQPSTVTTSATFSDMLSTFPQAVLSTINSVVLQSTTASSATTPFDSTARKDNLALQMGMWQSGRVGAGVKYWLSELTALRIDVQSNVDVGVSASSSILGYNEINQIQKDTGQPLTKIVNVSETSITPSVNMNIGLSATIEKHLFSKRSLSPYLGFGCGLGVISNNYTIITNRSSSAQDSGSYSSNNFLVGSNYVYVQPNLKRQGTNTSQFVVTRTSVVLSGFVSAGVEYFVLPSLSIAAEANLQGGIAGNVNFDGSFNQEQTSNSPKRYYYGISNSDFSSKTIQDLLKPGVSLSASVGFSSSLTLSLYFGRNVLGDIVNAFTSGTLFQW
jgi:hypothetical protein